MDMVIDWILRCDEDMLAEMEHFQSNGYLVHGHDTFEMGPRMQAFLTTGIRSDHVPFAPQEALEKLRSGMWVMFCDSPIARILPYVLRAVTENRLSTRHAAFCIDDMDTRDVFETGHIDHQVRTAIKCGISPIQAVQMATLNAAELHRMDHVIGSIAPGKAADILLVGDLVAFNVEQVYASGQLAAANGRLVAELPHPEYPPFFYNTFNLPRKIVPEDLVLRTDPAAEKVKVLAMHIPADNCMRFKREACLSAVDGVIQSDTAGDVLYCAVVERHTGAGKAGLGFVSGFSLGGGTIATSLASPSCNVICAGSNPQDMALAINTLAEMGGGQIAVKDGEVAAVIPLPIAGCLADVPPEVMAEQERRLTDVIRAGLPHGTALDLPDVSRNCALAVLHADGTWHG